MAKKKGYPKRPKATSSLEVWKNYESRCKEVDKYNSEIEKNKKAKKTLMASVKKLKAKR